tara:strand:+ start:5250 stop:7265 length:2016 start_codon:yes stop_codon:yes gene_type:complete
MADDLLGNIEGQNRELNKRKTLINDVVKANQNLEGIAKKILMNQTEGFRLSTKQLQRQSDLAKFEVQRLENLSKQLALEKGISDITSAEISTRKDLTDQEKASLLALKDGLRVQKELSSQAEKELKIRKGAELMLKKTAGTFKILNKFGIDFDQILTEATKDIEDGLRNGVNPGFLKLQANAKIAGKTITGIGNALTSTLGVSISLGKSFNDYNKSLREFRQLTGQNVQLMGVMEGSILNQKDGIETLTMTSEQLGINTAQAFSPEIVKEAAELNKLLGVSAESTSKLALQAQAFGLDLDEISNSAFEVSNALKQSGKNAAAPKMLLEDINQISGRITANFADNPELLIEAAAEARRFGLELKDLENVQESLLNFEQSIQSELEAELLTGKQINLERARGFALVNDQKGLIQEITSNQEILNAFQNGNFIQQQAIEKSLGMSADQIQKIIFFQKLEETGNAKIAGELSGINKDEAERLAMQEQMQKSLDKVMMSLAPIVEAFAMLMDNSAALYTTLGLIGGIKIAGLITSMIQLGTALGATTISGIALSSALTLGLSALAVVAGIALINNAMKKAQAEQKSSMSSADDGIIDSSGGLVVSGPKGSVSLNSADTIVGNKNGIIAGTNLGGGGNRELMAKIDRLIAVTERGSTITMDGNLVGKSIANNTSKLG